MQEFLPERHTVESRKHILHKAVYGIEGVCLGKQGCGLKRFKGYGSGIRRAASSVMLLLVLLLLTGGMGSQKFFLPLFTYIPNKETGPVEVLQRGLMGLMPICSYSRENQERPVTYEYEPETEITLNIVEEGDGEGSRADLENESILSASGDLPQEAQIAEAFTLQELLEQENAGSYRFIPPAQAMEYDWEALRDYETLLSTFYTIDSYAQSGSDLFNLESLMGRDLTISKTDAAPQILIYHTHSREAFSDSVPGDPSQSVVGVGDFLARLLTEEYGYSVLHHTAEYDTVRDEAYAKSLPAIEQLLAENPSIQVVIDLHRDAGSESRNMTVDINGKPTARFMFFNGISRSKKTGDITYLANPNLQDNLAFSFQMQAAAGEYFPGLTRKVYIKQYRYNMHLRGRTLLIELGDENNTVEEAMNACYPIAFLLDEVLSGE